MTTVFLERTATPQSEFSIYCGAVGQDTVDPDYTFTPDGDVTWDDVHNPDDDVQGDPYEGEQTEDPFEYADADDDEAEEDADDEDADEEG